MSPRQTIGRINPNGFARPFRDQYTPAEEAAQDAAEAYAEAMEDELRELGCCGHYLPTGECCNNPIPGGTG